MDDIQPGPDPPGWSARGGGPRAKAVGDPNPSISDLLLWVTVMNQGKARRGEARRPIVVVSGGVEYEFHRDGRGYRREGGGLRRISPEEVRLVVGEVLRRRGELRREVEG